MKNFFKRFLSWQLLIGIVLGGIGGYAYYFFIGCNGDTCSITSDPVNSTLWGVLMGGVLFIKDKQAKRKNSDKNAPGPTSDE